MTPLIATQGLSRNFGGLKAVDDVDFTLLPGEIRALIGPNGAGKTTFVGLVSGRLQPSSGTIAFDGKDITDMPAHQRVRLGIAYTFQITSVFAKLTAYDNVALAVQRTLDDDKHRRGARAFHRAVDSGARAHRPRRPGRAACRHPVLRTSAAARDRDGPGAEAAPADPRRADARPVRQRDRQLRRAGARDRRRGDRAADRAQHGLRHAAGRPHHRARGRAHPRRGHAGGDPRRCRACSVPISGRSAMADALIVSGLDCFYGEVQVLHALSLELRRGEVLCVLGRNGAGKTTLLKAIMGLVPARRRLDQARRARARRRCRPTKCRKPASPMCRKAAACSPR